MSVYFSNVTAGTIKRVAATGGAVTLIAQGSTHPRYLAVDGAFVYWSDARANGAILKAPK
jgi:hypothetical protein